MHGLRLATAGGLTYEKTLVVGFGFWFDVSFQDQVIFYDYLPPWTASLLSKGMTGGTLVAILLTLLFTLKQGRWRRLEVALSTSAIPMV